VDNALMYLGRSAVHRLALNIAFGEALSPALPSYAMEAADLWRHSLLTAFVTQTVLEESNLNDMDSSAAYTCGLLHDIGKVLLARVIDMPQRQSIQRLLEGGSLPFLEAERQVVGVDHAEVGAALLEKWGLPSVIVEAVREHHHPQLKPRPNLSAVVHVADLLAHQTGYSPGLVSFAIRVDDSAIAALGLSEEAWQRLMISALDSQQQVKEMTSLL
jgi:putative nucleotidyltransferase with HDIG domain